MTKLLDILARIHLRTGTGVFEHDGLVHVVEVAQTPIGLRRASDDGIDVAAILSERFGGLFRTLLVRLPARTLALVPKFGRRAATDADDDGEQPKMQRSLLGIRANAVTLHSEFFDETHTAHQQAAERDDRGAKPERRATKVLEDSLTFAVAKRKLRLVVRARVEEVQKIVEVTGRSPEAGHRYEPAPWAVWRASQHIAPLKQARGVHLRFVVAETQGIAILACEKRALAWHVMSWADGSRTEALLQAFHLLRIHASRRLRMQGVDEVSVQGEPFAAGCVEALQGIVEVPVSVVPGPAYGGDLVAFGLALGAHLPETETFNLARSLQEEPSLAQLAPWGEAVFVSALFLCMYMVLHFNLSSLHQRLSVASQQVQSVAWAKGMEQPKLKAEAEALKREVQPLGEYLSRELSFAQALSTISGLTPPKVWLTSITAEDLLWEKNSNKTLGNRYVLLTAGVPAAREGLAPAEVNEAVRKLEGDAAFHKVLPHVKLADVNWHKESGFGYTVFSVLAVAQEATK